MKMTRLEWRYLQRIALDHPYFDTHKLPLTEKEAKSIVEANITMTGKEFVDSIYAKLGMTRPAEEKKCFAWLRNIGELFAVPPIRKIAIAVLVVILMTVFFAATPTGRAIAESIIQYIVTLFDDGSLAVSRSDNETQLVFVDNYTDIDDVELLEDQATIVYLDSFDSFTEYTGKTPVVLPLPCRELSYFWDSEINYLVLNATYEILDEEIITCQIWNAEELACFTTSGFTLYDTENTVYYSNEEGRIIIKHIRDDSVLEINAIGSFTVEELIKMLNDR